MSGYTRLKRRTILVHTKENLSYRGVLLKEFHASILLTKTQFLDGAHDLDGDILIPKSEIRFIQIPAEQS